MTKEAKLKKIIEKGIENGWEIGDWFFGKDDSLRNFAMEAGMIGLPNNAYYGILFDKSFAKAIWGEEPLKEWGTDEEGIPFLFDIPKWKGLLQQAVISDDPIDYYYKNM